VKSRRKTTQPERPGRSLPSAPPSLQLPQRGSAGTGTPGSACWDARSHPGLSTSCQTAAGPQSVFASGAGEPGPRSRGDAASAEGTRDTPAGPEQLARPPHSLPLAALFVSMLSTLAEAFHQLQHPPDPLQSAAGRLGGTVGMHSAAQGCSTAARQDARCTRGHARHDA